MTKYVSVIGNGESRRGFDWVCSTDTPEADLLHITNVLREKCYLMCPIASSMASETKPGAIQRTERKPI